MSTPKNTKKKPLVNLPFPMKKENEQNPDEILDDVDENN